MKALFIGADETVELIDVAGFNGIREKLGDLDFIALGGDLLMAVNDMGLVNGLPFNRRGMLFCFDTAEKFLDVAGDAIVFMDDQSDVPQDVFPEWVHELLSAKN